MVYEVLNLPLAGLCVIPDDKSRAKAIYECSRLGQMCRLATKKLSYDFWIADVDQR
jgi:hypothetical protein